MAVKIVKQIMVEWPNGHKMLFHSMDDAQGALATCVGYSSMQDLKVTEILRACNTLNVFDREYCEAAIKKPAEKPVRQQKPVQQELPLGWTKSSRPLGDKAFECSCNPARQAAGYVGGKAGKGVRHCSSPDRRRRGSVNFAAMTVKQRREYWRWADARRKARKAGSKQPSWEAWSAR